MNGIALLMMAATLGVEYDWQATDDGQIEYVLIVEPDFIPALGEGSEIRSSVPDTLESVQRLCIRIAQPAKGGVTPQTQPRKLPPDAFRSSRIGLRAAEPVTILWKALGQPEETNLVRYGYQPNKDGQLEYFVQIDPKLLRTLAPGDEIYTTLATEAGRADTFVVFANAKQLPKVPGKPVAPPLPNQPGNNLAGTLPRTNSPGAAPFAPAPLPPAAAPFSPPSTFNSPSTSPPATSTSFGPPAAPAFNSSGFNSTTPNANDKAPPLYPPPRTFGVADDPVSDFNSSRVNPATNYGPAQPAATDNIRGWDTNRTDPSRPNLNSTNPPYRPDAFATNGQQPFNNQPANDQYAQNFASNQNNNLRTNGPQLPPAGNAPYRPAVGFTQDHQPNTNVPNNSMAGNNLPNGNNGFNNPPPNPQAVGYGPMNDNNQLASLPRPGLRDDLRTGANATNQPVQPEKQQPWWWLVFSSFLLFISVGANFYLAWTAAEFYSRYRLAVERLRTSGAR